MAFAAAPAVIPAAIGVKEALREGAKVLTGDLVVFRGAVYRKREETFYGPDRTPKTKQLRKHTREVLEPVDVELHVNPLGIGLGAAAVAAAGLVGIVAWNGIRLPAPLGGEIEIFSGFKDTETGKALTDVLEERREEEEAKPPDEREACQHFLQWPIIGGVAYLACVARGGDPSR